jgi:hypothetical protein
MKKNLTKFIALSSVALLMLSSCKKDGDLTTSNGGKPGALTASTTTLVLDKTKINDSTTVINFNFTNANYGFDAAVTNTLQIDAAGDNWANPASATLSTKVLSQGYSTAQFNSLLLKLNLKASVAAQVNVRVMHSVSVSVAPVYTNVVALTVTPFNLTSFVYVPGAYEGPTWPNPGPLEDSLVSATDNGIYVGIINFSAGNNQFLIVPIKGSWANKYATTANPATGSSAIYPTEYVSSGGNNFYAPTAAGQYLVTLNINTNSLSIAPVDYYSVIGDAAQGWSTDVPMKFVNDGTNTWLAANVAMSVDLPPNDGFKIRQDDAWGYSWGTSGSTGILTDANGVNIGISAAGNYNVQFVMAPTPFGSAPVTTAPYTVTAVQ